jgi:hypothetical protein
MVTEPPADPIHAPTALLPETDTPDKTIFLMLTALSVTPNNPVPATLGNPAMFRLVMVAAEAAVIVPENG